MTNPSNLSEQRQTYSYGRLDRDVDLSDIACEGELPDLFDITVRLTSEPDIHGEFGHVITIRDNTDNSTVYIRTYYELPLSGALRDFMALIYG